MTTLVQQPTFNRDAVERLAKELGEPDALRQRRFEGLIGFDELPLPAGRQLDWSKLSLESLALGRELSVELAPLPEELVQRGVIFCDLRTALREHRPLLEKYFMTRGVPVRDNKFAALHAAFWSQGSLLYVPQEVEVTLPLRAQWRTAGGSVADFGHTMVIVERNAKVTYLDHYHSEKADKPSLFAGVTELFLGEGANVVYVADQRWGRHLWDASTRRAILEKDANLTWLNISLGSAVSKLRLESILAGSGSSAEMLGVTLAQTGQSIHYDTVQDHRVPNTKSDLLFKAALKEKSRTVYEGMIKVRPDAQKTDAYQACRNLLLSRNARADATPTLEIEANDVRCSHGATMGPVDPNQMFYLRSRGLSEHDAMQLIVDGFFEQPLGYITNEALREELGAGIDAALHEQ